MILKILGALAAVAAIFLLAASFQPSQFTFTRSITVDAPAKTCFQLVNNFHEWEKWSPWAKMDPGMQAAYEGPSSGVGATYSWEGNSKVGAGKMTLVKSTPFSLIDIQLEFLKPMKGQNLTEFTFAPEGRGTKVTWTMSGPLNLVGKAFHMVCSMDKMVGPDFEKGLAQLKAQAEGGKK
ncbi:MAG TPA: SRPBCC family protein [bacterium]|nr:SRPBCC family protein [bacterium]